MIQRTRTSMKVATGLLLAAALTSVLAHAGLSKKGAAEVVVTAIGPAGLKIESKTTDVQIKEDLTVVVQLTTLDSGIELRTKHMRDKYLEVQKYPTAELKVPRSSLKVPAAGAKVENVQASGQLTLHGQTKPVQFTYTASRDGQVYQVKGNVRVNMKEFGIEQPSFAGITVKPDVDIAITFSASES